MVQAALGGEVEVHTLDGGRPRSKFRKARSRARNSRCEHKGMPVLRSRDVGDLYIQVNVETPQNLTKRQRELLAEFESQSSNRTHPESPGSSRG